MAVGRFTGYQPLPDMPGAYSFQTANGAPLTFGGPEAERIKARLDAANAQTRTAGIDSIGGYGTENQPPSPEQIQSFRDALTPKPAAAAQPESAAPAQPGGELGYGMFVSPDGRIMRRRTVAGSAGVTKEQIAEKDANATAVRTGATEVRQEGPGANQEYLDTRSALTQAESDNLKKREADEIAQAQEQAQFAADQFQQVQAQRAEEALRVADLERKYAIEKQVRDKAIQDHTSSKVDPKRIFANPAVNILGGLAAGIGAYAATIGKTPNFAQQVLDQAIERDIAAQEAAIKLKGEKASNLISDLRQRGMSVEQARAAAKSIQVQHGAAKLAALQAKNAVPALQNHYNNIQVALSKSANQADEDYRLMTQPKVTQSTNKTFVQEKAGTRGGVVVEEVPDQLGAAGKLQGLQAGDLKNRKDAADLANPKGPAASPETRQAAGAVAEVGTLEELAKKYPSGKGIETYEGRTVVGRAWEDFANYVGGAGAGISSETAVERQDLGRIQQGLASANSVLGGQGSMTEPEQRAYASAMAPDATWGDVQRAIKMTKDRAVARGVAAQQVGEAGGNVVTK